MTEKRIDWGGRGDPDFVDVPYWRVAGSYATFGFVLGFCFCLILLTTCDAHAGGGEEQQQQQQMLEPEQYAVPNAPTVLVVDGNGGSSVGEWAALLTGIAALVGALEAFRRRRRRAPD